MNIDEVILFYNKTILKKLKKKKEFLINKGIIFLFLFLFLIFLW